MVTLTALTRKIVIIANAKLKSLPHSNCVFNAVPLYDKNVVVRFNIRVYENIIL